MDTLCWGEMHTCHRCGREEAFGSFGRHGCSQCSWEVERRDRELARWKPSKELADLVSFATKIDPEIFVYKAWTANYKTIEIGVKKNDRYLCGGTEQDAIDFLKNCDIHNL